MSHPVTRFARKCRYLIVKIEGPVPWLAVHELKGLHGALGHKIEELECHPGNTGAKTATTDTPTPRTSKPTIGVAS